MRGTRNDKRTPKSEAAAAREDAQETHPSHSKKSLM